MSRAVQSRLHTSYARLREHLAYLGLATAAEQLAPELERARDEASAPVEVLERLLAAEVTATAARRLAGRLRFAHYPLVKRLADFELDFQPSIDRGVLAELSSLAFVEERRNVLLLGPPGVGKTHCENEDRFRTRGQSDWRRQRTSMTRSLIGSRGRVRRA